MKIRAKMNKQLSGSVRKIYASAQSSIQSCKSLADRTTVRSLKAGTSRQTKDREHSIYTVRCFIEVDRKLGLTTVQNRTILLCT